jgi:hypothetical protein
MLATEAGARLLLEAGALLEETPPPLLHRLLRLAHRSAPAYHLLQHPIPHPPRIIRRRRSWRRRRFC